MATNTYVALDKITTGSAVASVTFTSINQGYTDLVLVVSGTTNVGGTQGVTLQFNSDTGTNYSRTVLYGNGSSAASTRDSNATSSAIGLLDDTQGNSIFYIMNYSNTTTYKTALARGNSAASQVRAGIGLWRSTAAITSMTVGLQANNIAAGTTFSLYGIKAWAPETTPKATGGYVYSDTNYWYHVFPFSGTFTPNQSLTCDYLVVAGGGGGGGRRGGGGGAGGLRSTLTATGGGGSLESPLSLSAQAYTVTVGAGGLGGAADANGSAGSNSVFSTITATGGGYGSGQNTIPNSGGSGGSGGGSTATSGGSRTASPVQGNNGGSGYNGEAYGGGGGGGAGAAGGNGTSSVSGNGGDGVAISAFATATNTGVNNYYAAGGGGGAYSIGMTAGTGGAGGGGNGNNNNGVGTPATVSTGSGGGGGSLGSAPGYTNYAGGNGGSGIVIVRYAKA